MRSPSSESKKISGWSRGSSEGADPYQCPNSGFRSLCLPSSHLFDRTCLRSGSLTASAVNDAGPPDSRTLGNRVARRSANGDPTYENDEDASALRADADGEPRDRGLRKNRLRPL